MSTKTKTTFGILFIFLLLGGDAHAAEGKKNTLVLEHADSTSLRVTDDGVDSYSYGHVLFSMGDDLLFCDRAAWLRSKGQIVCAGQVSFLQEGRRLHADSIIYLRAEQMIWAFGNVLLIDSTERMRLTGERMAFDRQSQLVTCDSVPRLIMDFDDSTALTEIVGRCLEFDRVARRGWAKDSVTVYRGEWVAECDFAEARPDSGIVILTENPIGRGNNTETRGDSIILYSLNRQLERVEVRGEAEGVFRPSGSPGDSLSTDSTREVSEENRLWGEKIIFQLADRRLSRIDATGAARSRYTPGVADSTTDELPGENHTSGDTLTIFLEDNQVARVLVRGGGQGTYLSPIRRDSVLYDTINYSGEQIEFIPDSSTIYLNGEGKIDYGIIELTAEHIRYQTDRKTLAAEGRPHPDSAGVIIGPPVLQDGSQTVYGERLSYNVGTGRGRIHRSRTNYEDAHYWGQDFHKFTNDEFFVEQGVYSTCELDPPHYSFRGKTMKLIRGDKVISRPVTLYLDQLPTLTIPFYIFPIKPGRHSGFLSMRLGNFESGDRFIDNIGYYWAASQYWDLESAINVHEETGIVFRGTVRYALRYLLNGTVTGTYGRESRWNKSASPPVREKRRRWSLNATHRHTISPTLSISGTASFVSDPGYYTDYSLDREERRNRILRSQVNISKRWKGASLTAYLENTDNLDSDQQTRRLPGGSFSLVSRPLIPAPTGTDAEKHWYNSIYFSYSTRFSHEMLKYPDREKRYAAADHRVSLSAPQKILSYITLSPQASATEAWYYVFDTEQAREDGVLIEEPARRGSVSLGASASTNLYGFLSPGIWGLDVLRHTISPRIGYSFTPAITKHDQLRSYTGRGGGSARRVQSFSLSLGQNLDAKITQDGKEKKVSLLSGGISTGYNFESDEHKWSNISSSVRTSLARQVTLSASAVHEIYDPQSKKLRWTNPTLKSFSISTATSLRQGGAGSSLLTSSAWGEADTLAPADLPFNASISYRYSETRLTNRKTKRHWIGGSLQISPTPNWRVKFTANYDLANHRSSDQSFEFRRDLHCWEGVFVWVPGGGRKGYYFKVNVKGLPDLKLEKSESGISGASFR